jgi:AcrR family transcriptional regulator
VPETPPALGRRDRKRLKTRNDLAAVALELFTERGFDAVTVNDITDRADVDPSTFFRHFGSKEGGDFLGPRRLDRPPRRRRPRPTGRACWLYERVTGSSARRWEPAVGSREFRAKLADFPRTLTLDLLTPLDLSGRRFLDQHGLEHEPLTWCLPISLLDGRNLPVEDPALIDVDDLHQLVRIQQLPLSNVAQRLSTTIDTVRYLAETSPPASHLDWAETHDDLAIIDSAGQLIAKKRITEDLNGFAELIEMLTAAGDCAEDPVPVAIETPRGMLVASLRATGRPVYSINPLAVARYRERHSLARSKSDHADAMTLANILRVDAHMHRRLPSDSELCQAIGTSTQRRGGGRTLRGGGFCAAPLTSGSCRSCRRALPPGCGSRRNRGNRGGQHIWPPRTRPTAAPVSPAGIGPGEHLPSEE